jgi:anti-anti-sigma factor
VNTGDEKITVRLLGLPVKAATEAAAHHDGLMRELALIRESDDQQALPPALRTLLDELADRFDIFAPEPREGIERAVLERTDADAQSVQTVDLEYRITVRLAKSARRLRELFDEVDAFCRAGEFLVTVESPPEARALRNWVLAQFMEQADGRSALSWLEWQEQRGGAPGPRAGRWSSTVDGQSAEVQLSGELDIDISPRLRDFFTDLSAGGVTAMSIDCSAVSFIDSVGLSVLIAIHRRCEEDGGAVTIVNPSRVVVRTLEIAGLAALFGVDG